MSISCHALRPTRRGARHEIFDVLRSPGAQFGEDAGDAFDAEIEGGLAETLVRRANLALTARRSR